MQANVLQAKEGSKPGNSGRMIYYGQSVTQSEQIPEHPQAKGAVLTLLGSLEFGGGKWEPMKCTQLWHLKRIRRKQKEEREAI